MSLVDLKHWTRNGVTTVCQSTPFVAQLGLVINPDTVTCPACRKILDDVESDVLHGADKFLNGPERDSIGR